MAVEKKKYADQQNIRTAAETILKATNTRIKERILTSSTYATDNANVTHVLSAKALYDLLGNIAAYSTDDGTGNTFISKIKALDLAIGTAEDTSTDETVYGAIAAVNERISGLTHLTYQVVEGDISTEVPLADAQEDVIYLQRKEPSYKVGRDGLLLDEHDAVAIAGASDAEYAAYYNQGNGNYYKADAVYGYAVASTPVELETTDPIFTGLDVSEPVAGLLTDNNAVVVAGEAGARYAAFYDETAEKWYKADQSITGYTVTNTQLQAEDDVFDDVDLVPDDTYTLYVCQITENSEHERTGIQWLEVGNTDITLTDYVSKSDYDIKEVQDRIMERIPDQTIIDQIQAAFNATDPYGVNAETTSYLDSWLPQAANP